jgi:hypothetical protein
MYADRIGSLDRSQIGAEAAAGDNSTQFSTPSEFFQDADWRLKAGVDSLNHTTGTCLFNLKGQRGGSFHVIVRDGHGSAGAGSLGDPDLTFSMSAEDFVAKVRQDLDSVLAIALAPLWLNDTAGESPETDMPL